MFNFFPNSVHFLLQLCVHFHVMLPRRLPLILLIHMLINLLITALILIKIATVQKVEAFAPAAVFL